MSKPGSPFVPAPYSYVIVLFPTVTPFALDWVPISCVEPFRFFLPPMTPSTEPESVGILFCVKLPVTAVVYACLFIELPTTSAVIMLDAPPIAESANGEPF